MTHRPNWSWGKRRGFAGLALVFCLVAISLRLQAATESKKTAVVPKWGRFEQVLKSRVAYSNAVQEAKLTVLFTSPLGETNQVNGFWDGGRIWRVRFAPDQPGLWKFQTICSDADNQGLHNRTGQFICSAATGPTRFEQHGPVRTARDHRHLEHADGTPFFWLADTVWNGARVSELKDWEMYASTRAAQKFSVVQWAVGPGQDAKLESAFTGFPDRIVINPDFFQRLDAKVEILSQAGLLSAIVPLAEMEAKKGAGLPLPDDQAALLVRYVTARWGAEPAAWLLAMDGDNIEKKAGRWKRIGRSVFGEQPHLPVVLDPGQTQWLLNEFRDQNWLDVFGCQCMVAMSDDARKPIPAGPFAREWNREPARPVIPFAPYENGIVPQSGTRFSAADVRRAVYGSLLMTPPTGVSYRAQGVANWDVSVDETQRGSAGANLPLWQRSLFLPAAKQMAVLGGFMNSIDFWRLRPEPKFVATQPGETSPRRYIAAAATEAKDLTVVYVPEDRTLDLAREALPPSPTVTWLNPRTGENSPAVAVVGENNCQFPTPDPGDWLLVMKAGK